MHEVWEEIHVEVPAVLAASRRASLSLVRRPCTANHAGAHPPLASSRTVGYPAAVRFFRGALRNFSLGLLTRRMIRTLDRVEARMAEQNTYLQRLADHFAPQFDTSGPPPERSVDFLNNTEAGLVLDYIERTQRETGRGPTDEEILRYLADEATIDLATRMETK